MWAGQSVDYGRQAHTYRATAAVECRTDADTGGSQVTRRADMGKQRGQVITEPTEHEFAVAFSFAGPQRPLAECLANMVRDAGFSVFYDAFYAAELWGKDLYVFFDEIYRKRARFCVMFVSQEYIDRIWTNKERQSAQERALAEKGGEYILPIKVEDVAVPGLPPTVGYVSTEQYSIEEIGQILIAKLRGQRTSTVAVEGQPMPVQRPAASIQAVATMPAGRIVFIGTDNKVRVMNIDGSGRAAFPTRGPASAPRWSPTTAEIVYGEELGSSPYRNQVVVLNPATSVSRVLVAPEVRSGDALHRPIEYWRYESIRWTPDGSAVAYKKAATGRFNHAYMRVAAGGGSPQEVAGFDFFSAASVFDLSPTDGRMAMTENGHDAQVGSSRLVIADLDGSNTRDVLSLGGTYLYRPVWTPDGQAVAIAQRRDNQPDWTLFLVNPDTGTQRVLGDVPIGSHYTFSPDGKWMVLSSGRTKQLLLVNLANFSEQRPLGDGTMPAWEPARSGSGA